MSRVNFLMANSMRFSNVDETIRNDLKWLKGQPFEIIANSLIDVAETHAVSH